MTSCLENEDEGKGYIVCWNCNGSGYILDQKDAITRIYCDICNGTGEITIKD